MDFLQRARESLVEAFEKGVEGCMGDEIPTRAQLRAQLRALKEQQEQRQFSAECTDLHELALEYAWDEVASATSDFSEARKLGSGASGTVFRGTLEEGIDVAVKLIEVPERGGFEEEVRLLSRCRHPNVVMLLGFAQEPEPGFLDAWAHKEALEAAAHCGQGPVQQCIQVGSRIQAMVSIDYRGLGSVREGTQGTVLALESNEICLPPGAMLVCWDGLPHLSQALVGRGCVTVVKPLRCALVYELLCGGDVNARLMSQAPYLWDERLRTAVGIARGLAHLHKHRPEVFHRDIKTANVLFGLDGTAKIADFGLACASKLRGDRKLAVESTAGTPGYLDPLYAQTGVVTEANEVYSFGAVLLELLTGRPPAVVAEGGRGLVFLHEELRPHEEGAGERVLEQLDARARWPEMVASGLAALALRCICRETDARPSFLDAAAVLHDLASRAHERMEEAPDADELVEADRAKDNEEQQKSVDLGAGMLRLAGADQGTAAAGEGAQQGPGELEPVARCAAVPRGAPASPCRDAAPRQDQQRPPLCKLAQVLHQDRPAGQGPMVLEKSAAARPAPTRYVRAVGGATNGDVKQVSQVHKVTVAPPTPSNAVVLHPTMVGGPAHTKVTHVGVTRIQGPACSGLGAPVKVVCIRPAPVMSPAPVRIVH